MKNISFDFSQIKSYADFYTALGHKLTLPSYFGNNLDALYDYLSGGAEMPLKIEFIHCNGFKRNAFSKLIQVMKNLHEQLEEFDFKLEEE